MRAMKISIYLLPPRTYCPSS